MKRATHRSERGVTLIEMMVVTVMMLIVLGGALMFLASQSRTHQSTSIRSELSQTGASALSLMEREIGMAGLGLPRRLAIQELVQSTDVCATKLSVARIDPERRWTLTAHETGKLTLLSATPQPSAAGDQAIPIDTWLFLYRHSTVGTTGTGDHGHGMVQVTSDRVAGDTTILIDAVNNYSTLQPVFDVDTTSVFSQPGPDASDAVAMVARVSIFEVDCTTDASMPILTWEAAGAGPLPVAQVAEALSFRFLVDADADGFADDQNGDSAIDANDLVTTPASMETVTAVEVAFTLRSRNLNQSFNPPEYRRLSFREVIQTPNIHTASDSYIFVQNTAW